MSRVGGNRAKSVAVVRWPRSIGFGLVLGLLAVGACASAEGGPGPATFGPPPGSLAGGPEPGTGVELVGPHVEPHGCDLHP